MKKIIIMILIVISIVIIALGFSLSYDVCEIFNSIDTTQNIDINESEKNAAINSAIDFFGHVYFTILFPAYIIIYSVVAVACIWGIYGVILLVIAIIKKYKLRKNK